MSNTTNKKSNAKATTKKSATTTTSKAKDKELEALKKELADKIALLDAKLAEVNGTVTNVQPVVANVQSVANNYVENFDEPHPNKKTKVYSMVFGLFTIHCPTRGFTEFKEYGNFKILSYAQLTDYMLTCSETFKQGRLYISDPQIVEALGLTEYYEELFSMSFVNDLIKSKIDKEDITDIISKSNEKQKDALGNYFAILVYEGKFEDYNIINEVAKATGVDINRKVNEMRQFAENAQTE